MTILITKSTPDFVRTGLRYSEAGLGDHVSATCRFCGRVGGLYFPGLALDKDYRLGRLRASGWVVEQLEGDHFYSCCVECVGTEKANSRY